MSGGSASRDYLLWWFRLHIFFSVLARSQSTRTQSWTHNNVVGCCHLYEANVCECVIDWVGAEIHFDSMSMLIFTLWPRFTHSRSPLWNCESAILLHKYGIQFQNQLKQYGTLEAYHIIAYALTTPIVLIKFKFEETCRQLRHSCPSDAYLPNPVHSNKIDGTPVVKIST